MKKLIIQIFISSIFIFNSTFLLFGQEKVIRGRVTTFDSIPLIGVSIKVKSSKEVVFSDTLGMFKVSCLQEDKLKVTARGFSNQNVKIDDKTKLVLVNLKLNPGPKNRELAFGYGHVKDRDKLQAMSGISENDINFSSYADVYSLIKGRFPGVRIINNEVVIHYPQTMGNNAALVVVDGIAVNPGYLSSLSTSNIASISILKDASIYGIGGANGAVVIETKSGRNQ